MKPRTKWYANVLGVSAMGIFFLSLGIYGVIASLGHSSVFFIAGAGCVFLGLRILWLAVQWTRPLKTSPEELPRVCPFCGAIVQKDATFCAKCERKINR